MPMGVVVHLDDDDVADRLLDEVAPRTHRLILPALCSIGAFAAQTHGQLQHSIGGEGEGAHEPY
jgi:hypothetical protein